MREDFLHYVWKFLKFDTQNLTTTQQQEVRIEKVGQHNFNSGPDFFNALVWIGGQQWAGNVEIHLKSSDWYAHHHERDPAYDSVILHVVWEHDTEVFRKDESVIPTVVLQDIVSGHALAGYDKLFGATQQWIPCENEYPTVAPFTITRWLESLYFERLKQKSEVIMSQLQLLQNDWEAVLFSMLAKGFGLKVNGASFLSIAQSFDFSVVKKCSQKELLVEALLFGQAGLLKGAKNNDHFRLLKSEYSYLKNKFRLDASGVISPQFFRLRPPNFPTIRLSQFASLYTVRKRLFAAIISVKKVEEFYEIFNVQASTYWDRHFNFDIESNLRRKGLTKKFVNLLIINVILPLKYCYAVHRGKDVSEEISEIAMQLDKENNTIVTRFNTLQPIATNAMLTQGLLQLKNNYCDAIRCTQCEIGNAILK